MPLYRVALRFATDQPGQPFRKWSNTFFAEETGASIAAFRGLGLWNDGLRAAARERVYLYQVYAADLNPATDDYYVLNVDPALQRGNLPTPTGEPYQPKTCVAVTLPVSGSRPSRKFWRPGLFEGDVANGVSITPALATIIQTQWDQALTSAESYWLDPDGQTLQVPVQLRLSTREFGREATADVPVPPPLS
jgi:hypothetical protein